MSLEHATVTKRPVIFISAAEPSADLAGAALIRATQARCPSACFAGVAGPHMRSAGCEPIFDMTAGAAMLLGAVASARKGLQMLRASAGHLRRFPIDAAVLIDSPVLHLRLARHAKRLGIPVLYYVAPQLWAWGSWRMGTLRRRVDRIAAILPFEEDYFRRNGIDARFVGHPLAERVRATGLDEAKVRELRGTGSPFVALLPGSRRHVVEEVLPGQLDVAARILDAFPDAAFGVSVANEQTARVVHKQLSAANRRMGIGRSRGLKPAAQVVKFKALDGRSPPIRAVPGGHAELIRAADLVLVASGTSTLEVAFHARPMIVMYRASRLFYHLIGRWLIRTPHYALPNILAKRRIVPEFVPYYGSTGLIAETAVQLLASEEARRRMTGDLEQVVHPLREHRASENAALMLLEMVNDR